MNDLFSEPPDIKTLRYRIQRTERLLSYWLNLDDSRSENLAERGPGRKRMIAEIADTLAALRTELATKLAAPV